MPIPQKNFLIKPSTIKGAGNGVFTNIHIAKGTRILEYKGRITNWATACEDDPTNPYLFYVTEDYVIDGMPNKKAVARYVNDAKGITRIKGIRNNCEFRIDGQQVFIDAIKDINAGEEVLVAYGKEYWDIVKQQLKSGELKWK